MAEPQGRDRTMAAQPLIAGNWKMNGLQASIGELDRIIAGAAKLRSQPMLIVCPPATLVAEFAARAKNSSVWIGAQDCHFEDFGAFTGDVSAPMLADAGARAVIVGHSERRTLHQESDALVRGKVLAAWGADLIAIVCVGETEFERQAGATLSRLERQLEESLPDNATADILVVAYEPVWAIGTGRTPTASDVAEVHAFIRRRLCKRFGEQGEGTRILYGGSVKPGNAAELLGVENVNGALVGGASLKAEEFLAIASAV
jgi:triosephosphate isomerase (TIM)